MALKLLTTVRIRSLLRWRGSDRCADVFARQEDQHDPVELVGFGERSEMAGARDQHQLRARAHNAHFGAMVPKDERNDLRGADPYLTVSVPTRPAWAWPGTSQINLYVPAGAFTTTSCV